MLDIHDLAIAREQGADLVAVGALVGKPLAALIAQPGVGRPRDLEGRTVGVSGLPSDPAFLRAIVDHDGGDYDKVKQVTIGFNAVSRLLTKRVDAVPGVLERRGRGAQGSAGSTRASSASRTTARRRIRRSCSSRRARRSTPSARDRGGAGRDRAPARRDARASRTRRSHVIAKAAETDDTELVRAQLDAVLPLFADELKLDRARARALGRLRRADRAREDPPRRGEAFDFPAPLNAGRPNAVTVRAAIDQFWWPLSGPPGLQSRV